MADIEEVKQQSTTQPAAQPTPQAAAQQPAAQEESKEAKELRERLDKLTTTFQNALNDSSKLEEEHKKLVEKMYDQEKKKFQALAELTNFKEQLLVNRIGQLQNQVEKKTA
jgi:hypothetical protein